MSSNKSEKAEDAKETQKGGEKAVRASIMTKKGDSGMTDLWNRERVSKDDCRVEAIGQLDTAQAWIGKFYAEMHGANRLVEQRPCLLAVLRSFHDVMASVATPNRAGHLDESRRQRVQFDESLDKLTQNIEQESFAIEQTLPPLREFILPTTVYSVHVARTAVRTAERAVWAVERREKETISHAALRFLNRVSDYLFLLARLLPQIE